jgi:pyroglutamyl-peptidase
MIVPAAARTADQLQGISNLGHLNFPKHLNVQKHRDRLNLRILITGFGPFPGAPYNPTGPLVARLARARTPGLTGAHIATHVFQTTYRAVDRDLPLLLEKHRPDLLLMFGLAARTPWLRIETQARNTMTPTIPDAEGRLPRTAQIVPDGPPTRTFSFAVRHLAQGHAASGVAVRVSKDAGRYLCNYLCWKAIEASGRSDGPAFAAFIHVPKTRHTRRPVPKRHKDAYMGAHKLRKAGRHAVSAATLECAALVFLRKAAVLARQQKSRRRDAQNAGTNTR